MRDDHPLDQLETTQRSLTRVQNESFDFRLHRGDILVTNLSYDDPSDHVYRVTVTDGTPVVCTCPADEHYSPACKHRIAVAMRSPVISAADRMQVAADGGVIEPEGRERHSSHHSDEKTAECDCSDLPEGIPCWPCYRDGNAEFDE